MTPADLQAQLTATGYATLEPGDYHFAGPLVLPADKPIALRGAGQGLTNLFFQNGHGIVAEGRKTWYQALTIDSLSIYAVGEQADAIRIAHEWASFANDPQVLLKNLHIAPAPGMEHVSSWGRAIALDHVWGPKVQNCWIAGNFSGVDVPALDAGHADVAIELGGSQEAKITDSYIGGYRTGVHVAAPLAGCGEGFALDQTAIINCKTCVRLEGQPAGLFGGFSTPWASISDCHLFYLEHAVFATNRYDLTIHDNSLCGSHLIPSWGIGVYLVDCSKVRIANNNFWTTRLGQGTAIAIDASIDGTIVGNTIDESMMIGVWLANQNGPVTGWRGGDNAIRTPYRVLDYGTNNFIVA